MKFLVEPYNPLIGDDSHLRLQSKRTGWASILIITLSLAIIGISLIDIPASLGMLVLLIIPAMIASMMVEDRGWEVLYPVRRKRGPHVRSFTFIGPEWYSSSAARSHEMYNQKLGEYLDFLRMGNPQNETIERHIAGWLEEADRAEQIRGLTREKNDASLIVDVDQLKAYRKALQDVEKTSD